MEVHILAILESPTLNPNAVTGSLAELGRHLQKSRVEILSWLTLAIATVWDRLPKT